MVSSAIVPSSNQDPLMVSVKKRLVAARGHEPQSLPRLLDGLQRLHHLVEHVEVQRVVDPATFLAVGHEARVLQRTEMERQEGLARAERAREVTDALLAVA